MPYRTVPLNGIPPDSASYGGPTARILLLRLLHVIVATFRAPAAPPVPLLHRRTRTGSQPEPAIRRERAFSYSAAMSGFRGSDAAPRSALSCGSCGAPRQGMICPKCVNGLVLGERKAQAAILRARKEDLLRKINDLLGERVGPGRCLGCCVSVSPPGPSSFSPSLAPKAPPLSFHRIRY